VTIGSSTGGFDVSFVAIPSRAGTFANPRSGGTCGVDPGGVINEPPGASTSCSDTVTVTAPQLTAVKSDDVHGLSTVGHPWSWKIHVANAGNADATFSSGQTILIDNLPDSNIAYGSPAVSGQTGLSGAGSVSCQVAANDLTCTAGGGPVTIGQSTGAFDVSFMATASQPGTFANPRSGGICSVDPGGVIDEPGASTSCSDTVVVPVNPSVQVTTPPDGATYNQGETVNASYGCAEAALGPGIQSCTGPVPNGTAIDTSTAGQHSFTVTATSKDGLTATITHHYTVIAIGAPTATISSPADGASYNQGQTVNASYGCTEAAHGPGIQSCSGPVPNGSAIDTSTAGQHSFTVTATSKDGLTATVTHHYTVIAIGAPTATISSPADNQIFTTGQHVTTSFSCAEGANGPGLESCTDSDGAHSPTGQLDTSHVGTFAYTVRATSKDGQTATATIHYNVVPQGTIFRITNLKVRHNGVVTFTVIVPSAGTTKVLESASKHDEEPHASAAAALLQPARGRFAFARAQLVLHSGGTFHMRIAPNKRGQRLVAHHRHPLRIRLWVTFKRPNGHPVQIGFYGLSVTR
jgi:hypothetical protein